MRSISARAELQKRRDKEGEEAQARQTLEQQLQLKTQALVYLAAGTPAEAARRAAQQYDRADNMTDRQGALMVLCGLDTPQRKAALADAGSALGINPVGQSGVLFDQHYKDQAERYIRGEYVPMHLDAEAIKANSRSQLILRP